MSRAGWRWLSRAALDRDFRPNAVLQDDFGRCCSGKRPPYSGKSSALNRNSAGGGRLETPLPFPASWLPWPQSQALRDLSG